MINFTPIQSTFGGAIIGESISEYVFRSVIALEGNKMARFSLRKE